MGIGALVVIVALRKESVDRNDGVGVVQPGKLTSLSARRAWIEIDEQFTNAMRQWSLSARRAWIEIPLFELNAPGTFCRSPQGERG